MKAVKINVVRTGPLDNFDSVLPTVEQWICDTNMNDVQRQRRKYFIQALIAVHKVPWFDGDLRLAAHIGYNCEDDSVYFIFKTDNNGITFLVSSGGLPCFTNVDMQIESDSFEIDICDEKEWDFAIGK